MLFLSHHEYYRTSLDAYDATKANLMEVSHEINSNVYITLVIIILI